MHDQLDSKDSCKEKTLKGVVCIGSCLCLGTRLAFLKLHEGWPPKALTWLLSIDVVANLEQNAMHDIKNEWWSYDKEGKSQHGS
jgi:hypothetical protein